MTTRINRDHLDLVIKTNGYHSTEIKEQIMEATADLNRHYFNMIAERMSVNNADILSRFIIYRRKERNISRNTVMTYIDGIVYLENYNNHKDFNKMDKKDIISFLDSYRKSETADPLYKWINTYNLRLDIIYKFFKWLYNLENGRSADELAPPIMNGIKRLKRKEKSPYQAKDLWTHEDDALFLKYCEDSRLKCYHTMARDTSGRPHEILNIRVGDIMWQMTGTATQYAEVTIGKGGKTKQRTVPLINSIPFVKDWVQKHPTGNNRNSFLFPSLERRSKYRNMSLRPLSVAIMYRRQKLEFFPRLLTNPDISEEEKNKIRILLEKPWNPYIRRHTALTEKWKLLKSEQALRMHAGWSKTSKMVEIYTHEFGNESSELLLQAYGVIPVDAQENNILKPRQCPNCNESNKPDARYCGKCKMVLTYDAYNETIEKEQKRELELCDLKKKLEAVQEEQNQKFNQLMDILRTNPKLVNIKPEVLIAKNV